MQQVDPMLFEYIFIQPATCSTNTIQDFPPQLSNNLIKINFENSWFLN